ncbi:MAG: hypothetical protein HKN23_21585, partial [Verrucomicrobiales bacterium]|nr:hypothetical protein [Verrucomicrobiales bacterium]
MPEDVKAALYVDPIQTQNPSASCFDDTGRLYIAEIHRWRAGVQDIRKEQRMLHDDVAIKTSADRLKMYEKDQLNRPLSFYTEYEDRIVMVEDTDGDGRADKSSVYADGFNDILDGPGIGVVYHQGSIYYTNIPNLWKLTDINGDGKADEREVLQDGFGVRMSLSGHDMHGAIVGPDGKIYWSVGDRGYTVTTKEGRHYPREMEGGVLRCDPDGSNVEEVYRGLRNPQELAFDKYGNLFTCDNTADAWDEGRLVYIIEGGDTGWNAGHQNLLNFRDQLNLRTPDYSHPGHEPVPLNPWTAEELWNPHGEGRPAFALPAIDIVSWGPSGFVYNYGAVAMPERYKNHFWVCNFGGANGDLEAFSVKEKGAGFALDHHEKFMVGLGNTDVEFGPDGRMYLSCFNNNGWYKQDIGNVYALFDEKALARDSVKRTKELLTSDFSKKEDNELGGLLVQDDMRVRLRAQFELVARDQIDALWMFAAGEFLTAGNVTPEKVQLARLHGIWGLGQLAREDESLLEHLVPLLSDEDAEVRAQAAKVLADSRTEMAGKALQPLLSDESNRVKAFAAIGIGKCGNVSALLTAMPRKGAKAPENPQKTIQDVIIENNDEDVFLRHACVQAMWYLNEKEKILKLVDHDSAALRLAVLLTLRKLEDPRVKYFLGDPEQHIRYEAIRAINDLDLPTAWPDLAKQIEPFALASEGVEMPEGHQDAIIHTRLINANFRVGTEECAQRLITYAAQPKLPQMLRQQALAALEEWPNPTPVDPTVGLHRPLDPAKRIEIAPVVKEHLSKVFENAEGEVFAAATRLAVNYEAEAPADQMLAALKKSDNAVEARVGALKVLARQQPNMLKP